MLCVFFPVDPVSEQALRPLARRIYFHHGSHYLQLNRGALLVDLWDWSCSNKVLAQASIFEMAPDKFPKKSMV